MGNVKKGNLTRPPEWWKHLKFRKKDFWKRERVAEKKEIKRQLKDQ